MNTEDNTLLAKWLDQSITPEELMRLKQEVDLESLKAILDQQSAFEMEVKDANSMWNSFSEQIDVNQPKQIIKPHTAKRIPLYRRRSFIGTAAAMMIGIIGFVVFQSINSPVVLATVASEQKTQTLADGSTVKISPDSEVLYHEHNWDSERKLELNGQAFFEVTKGSPFSVETETGTIQVLGTAFDIWSSGDYMRVQCFEGKVKVTEPTKGNSILLTAGQQIQLNKSIFGAVQPLENSNPDWIDKNKLDYKGIPIGLVIKDIERFVGLEVKATGLDMTILFTGTITFDTAEESARYLAQSMGWQYAVTKNDIQFSN